MKVEIFYNDALEEGYPQYAPDLIKGPVYIFNPNPRSRRGSELLVGMLKLFISLTTPNLGIRARGHPASMSFQLYIKRKRK